MVCPNCGSNNREGATFCTQCGSSTQKPGSKSKSIFKWAGIGCGSLIGFFVIIVIIVAIVSSGDDGNVATEGTPASVATPTPVPIMVSARELYQAYDSNEVAADLKYKGKTALIDGSISSITEAGSKYDIKLSTDEVFSFTEIVCKVDKSLVESVIALSEGQYITVMGMIKGKSISDIVVEDCSVQDSPQSVAPAPVPTESMTVPTVGSTSPPTVEPTPGPTHPLTLIPTPSPTSTPTPNQTPTPIIVSAGELYQDYESNEVAAKATYEGKTALIDGSISSITEAGGKYDVKLSTDEVFSLTSIVCKMDRSQVESVIALSDGQYVTVMGMIKGKSISDIVVEDCSVQDSPQSVAPAPVPTESPTAKPVPIVGPIPTPTLTTKPLRM